ncbi:MAG: HU family DNA-binding protein [Pseudomonadota bacterium]
MARATTTKKTTTRATAARKGTTRKASTASKAKASAPKTRATKSPSKGVVAPKVAVPAVEVAREFKKKELIERVVAATGAKKGQARPVIEATLAILGEAMAKGEAMNLEPLGKLKVQKEKDVGAATVYSCRVRRKKSGATDPKPPLAEAAE